MISTISRWILRIFGWKIINHIPNDLKKYIIAVVPHTSNWDFVLGMLVRSALNLKTGFIGKKSLFVFPHGFFFYWLGGQPVDRSKSQNYVDQVAEIFNKNEAFSMALAPEGTRKKVDKLKTGFYFIAKKANIPIILCKFDAVLKIVELSTPFFPSDDIEKDFNIIENYFKGIKGFKPENSFGV
jgi:1-acyl-sn-glycerol-3-phosphate acyltransferase